MSYESDARIAEHNAQVWEQILDETSQTPGDAFFKTLVRFCGGELTMDKYDDLCLCPSALQVSPSFDSKDWHRGTLEFWQNRVIEALRNQGWTDERIENDARNLAGKQLRNMTKPEVRSYEKEIGFRSTVKTANDARAYLAKHRLLESQKSYFAADGSGPFPRLPQNIVPAGFVTSVPLNAKFLNELASQDMAAFQRMCRRYHISQINERLSQTASSLEEN